MDHAPSFPLLANFGIGEFVAGCVIPRQRELLILVDQCFSCHTFHVLVISLFLVIIAGGRL
jgi:hypothetical protein